jgi:hypothetical protein
MCVAGCLASAVLAADPSADAVRNCGAIADNFARLACFDNLARSAPAASAPAAAAPAAAASAPVAAAAAVGVAAAPAGFADEALKKSTAERAAAASAAPTDLTAKVTAMHEISYKRFRVSLDNGHVWQQEETQPLTMPEVQVGDTVHLEKGSLGGYRMAMVRNGKDLYWTRVTRLK